MKQSVKSRSITRKPWRRFFTPKNITISDKQRVHLGHKGEMTMNNHDDNEKRRRRRWLHWLNLYSAAVSTLAVLLAIAHALQKM